MQPIRTILFRTLLGGILIAPLFVFAQTQPATTTPPGIYDPQNVEDLINKLISEQIPKTQNVRTTALTNYLDVKTTPSNPGPKQAINVTIESYLTDLDKATITWSLNGKVVSSGQGKRVFNFQNGDNGETTRLSVSIKTSEGDSFNKQFSWRPIGVTVLWEAGTYTPPFYRGKALLTPQAQVKMVALPDITTGLKNALDAGNLAYVWKKDGSVVSSASGYGKNVFIFPGPKPFANSKISVLASSSDNTTQSETRVGLTLSQPFILFYEKDPLFGTWYNHPINSTFNLNKKEFSISAEPYFFSKEDSDYQILNYNWSLNSRKVQNDSKYITLRNNTGVQGTSAVSLSVSNSKQTFQAANNSFGVNFISNENLGGRPSF